MAAAAPGPAKISGSIAASFRAKPRARVDWRRSARDDHLYVREQEWEAAHTVWIWPDRSPSMVFASPLVWETKLDRALIIAFALAEILVEGGERVGIPGLLRPTASRNVVEKIAQAILHDHAGAHQPAADLRALAAVRSHRAFGFVEPDRRSHQTRSRNCPRRGASGHIVQIVDPVEETFPYAGRIEFVEPEGAGTITAGRAETWRDDYQCAHRAPPRRHSRRNRPARLELHHSSHRPARERTAAQTAWPAWRAAATVRLNRWRNPASMEQRA